MLSSPSHCVFTPHRISLLWVLKFSSLVVFLSCSLRNNKRHSENRRRLLLTNLSAARQGSLNKGQTCSVLLSAMSLVWHFDRSQLREAKNNSAQRDSGHPDLILMRLCFHLTIQNNETTTAWRNILYQSYGACHAYPAPCLILADSSNTCTSL